MFPPSDQKRNFSSSASISFGIDLPPLTTTLVAPLLKSMRLMLLVPLSMLATVPPVTKYTAVPSATIFDGWSSLAERTLAFVHDGPSSRFVERQPRMAHSKRQKASAGFEVR